MDVLTIGKGITVLRSELHLSQAKAAARVTTPAHKIYRQQWSRFEAGLDIPSTKSLYRIVYGLGSKLASFEQASELAAKGMDTEQIIEFRRQYAATPQAVESVYDEIIGPMLNTHMRRIRELEAENQELKDQLASVATTPRK